MIEEGDREHRSGSASPSSRASPSASASCCLTEPSPRASHSGPRIPGSSPTPARAHDEGAHFVLDGSTAFSHSDTLPNAIKDDHFPVGYETSTPFDGGELADFHVRSMASTSGVRDRDREGYESSGTSDDDEDDMVRVSVWF